jgi:hypothetical protein
MLKSDVEKYYGSIAHAMNAIGAPATAWYGKYFKKTGKRVPPTYAKRFEHESNGVLLAGLDCVQIKHGEMVRRVTMSDGSRYEYVIK